MRFTLTEADIDAVHRVKHCASRDETRPALRGVVISEHLIVATDSYRMAWHPVDSDRLPSHPVLLTPATINDLPVDGDCTVSLAVPPVGAGWGMLSFTVGPTRFDHATPSLPEHAWWHQRLPTFHRVTVDRSRVLEALAQVKPRGGVIALHTESKLVSRTGILGDNPDGTAGHHLVPITEPPDFSRGILPAPPYLPTAILDAKFFKTLIGAVAAPRLTITVDDPLRPVHIQGEDELLEQILLPVRGWRD